MMLLVLYSSALVLESILVGRGHKKNDERAFVSFVHFSASATSKNNTKTPIESFLSLLKGEV